MDSFFQMFQIQMILLVYLVCGFLCHQYKIITSSSQQQVTNLTLQMLMPCMVFQSFRTVTVSLLLQSMSALWISCAVCLFSFLLGKLLYHRFDQNTRSVLRYATLINNAGFAGLPLAQAMYGEQGVLIASIFLIPIRIFMWSAGITMLSSKQSKPHALLLKLLKNPNIIAVLLGILRGLLAIDLPDFLDSAITSLSLCVSPLSMILIGVMISQVKPTALFERGVLLYTFVRLLLLPILVLTCMRCLRLDPILTGTCLMLTAMPAATSTALLASQYQADATLAAKLILVSTITSIITAPLLMLL